MTVFAVQQVVATDGLIELRSMLPPLNAYSLDGLEGVMEEPRFEDYGLQPAAGGLDERVASALVEYLRKEESPDFARDRLPPGVLENADLFYVPLVWIGCAGLLVLKPDLKVIGLGSYTSAECQIWAYYRGIDFTRDWNDLVVTQIHNDTRSRELLRTMFTGRRYWDEVVPALKEGPPWRFSVKLFYRIPELIAAEQERAFDFVIEPPTEPLA